MSPVKPGSKYSGLHQHLRGRADPTVQLTFAQIEDLLGSALPPSARRGKAFWSNRAGTGLQAAAWLEAGFRVAQVDLGARSVTFSRARVHYSVRREEGHVVWEPDLIRALRAHLGLNQAELADVLGVRQQTISEWERGSYSPTRASEHHLTLVAERAGFDLRET
jgi:DNA-binding transcriptional regulator YiaG